MVKEEEVKYIIRLGISKSIPSLQTDESIETLDKSRKIKLVVESLK